MRTRPWRSTPALFLRPAVQYNWSPASRRPYAKLSIRPSSRLSSEADARPKLTIGSMLINDCFTQNFGHALFRTWIKPVSLFGAISVALAAWGTHGLISFIPAEQPTVAAECARAANLRLLPYPLALFGVALWSRQAPSGWLNLAGGLFTLVCSVSHAASTYRASLPASTPGRSSTSFPSVTSTWSATGWHWVWRSGSSTAQASSLPSPPPHATAIRRTTRHALPARHLSSGVTTASSTAPVTMPASPLRPLVVTADHSPAKEPTAAAAPTASTA